MTYVLPILVMVVGTLLGLAGLDLPWGATVSLVAFSLLAVVLVATRPSERLPTKKRVFLVIAFVFFAVVAALRL